MLKICIPSFSRSDYSSLAPLILYLRKSGKIETQVVAGGSHLNKRYGESINDFERDGINIFHKIDFLSENDDSEKDFTLAFGKLFDAITSYFLSEKPDRVFILGDRWEMLAVSMAAYLLRIPIIHHSGGDLTQGSLDNQTRYILSEQASLHLVALREHRDRLIARGEEEWRVKVVGEPALTRLHELKESLIDSIESFSINRPFVLATFHPTTNDDVGLEEQIDFFVECLKSIELPILITAPNSDANSKAFLDHLLEFERTNERVKLVRNLGSQRYYTCMSKAVGMIGNSSSGIWEAPSFKLGVINIGKRQSDRLRSTNVIDVSYSIEEFKQAFKKLRSSEFQEQVNKSKNPYVLDDTLELIEKNLSTNTDNCTLLEKLIVDPLRVKE